MNKKNAIRRAHPKGLIKVSPFNPSPRWPDGYVEVLEDAGVHASCFLAYANHVRAFFACHPGKPRRSLGPAEIAKFLEGFKQKGGDSTEWLQAREALILYYEKFRGIPLVKRSSGKESGPGPGKPRHTSDKPRRVERRSSLSRQERKPLDWKALKCAYLTAIRVENYARTTEKTYWHWIRAQMLTDWHGQHGRCGRRACDGE